MSKTIVVTLLAIIAAAFWAPAGFGQDKPKDEELDKFLQKLDGSKTPDSSAPSKDAKPGEGAKRKPGAALDAKKGDVAPNDKDLDSFLEKLGETRETPSPEERPSGLPKPANDPPVPRKAEAEQAQGRERPGQTPY